MVLVSPSVKICDFLFFTAGMLDTSALCRRSEEKKERERHYSDTGVRRVLLVPVSDRYFAKNGMSVQPRKSVVV